MFDNHDNATRKLYVIDMDGVLFPINPKCFPRFAALAGHVAHAYTGLDYQVGEDIAMQSFQEHGGDGFKGFLDYGVEPHTYMAMHRHFNMIVRIDRMCDEGEIDPELPNLIWQLSRHHDVCFATHATTRSAKTTLSRRGYHPILIEKCYGLDNLGSQGFTFKSESPSDVFSTLARLHKTTVDKIILIEDTKGNIAAAMMNGIERGVLVTKDRCASDVVRQELALVRR